MRSTVTILFLVLPFAVSGRLNTAGTSASSPAAAATMYNYPAHWYRFNNASNLGQDYADPAKSGEATEDIAVPSQDKAFDESNGGVLGLGGYLACTFNCSLDLSLPNGSAIEFIFRTNGTGWFLLGAGRLEYASTSWSLNYPWNQGAYSQGLGGTGAHSMNYAQRGWHTLAISRNSSGGVLFCLDGVYCGGKEANNSLDFADWRWSVVPSPVTWKYVNHFLQGFAIDEIAVYKDQLTAESMYAHYVQVMEDHKEYEFKVPTPQEMPIPEPTFPAKEYNMMEFPPGANLSSGNPTQGVNLTALEQLEKFPDPEYPTAAGTTELFERNFNWMAPSYMGGGGQPTVPPQDVLNNSLNIQEILYKKWHYGVVFENLDTCCSEQYATMIDSFSRYTDKVDIIILRLETRGGTVLYNHTLPDACYLQNKHGQFLNQGGAVCKKPQAHLRLLGSEGSMAAAGCPYSTFFHDGDMFNESLSGLQAMMNKKAMKFDRINNDGEAMNIIGAAAALKDPMVKRDFEASGAANWLTYWSEWRRRMSNPTFRDLFMGGPGPDAERGNATGRFTQYQIQGTNPYFGNWSVTREIMQPLKNNQYYSCADFYPENPATVFMVSRGPWHGMGWMKNVRASEIASGNPWFSPFVAAGWSGASENNIRPAQWLGLMKIFAGWGAEFFYAGFFSLSSPFPPSENWIWQAAMPSYAQAITAQYADIFFNGTFLGWAETGYSNIFTVVRQSNTNANEYIITLTVQNQANWEGNAFREIHGVNVVIPKSEPSIVAVGLTARRQGSVYRYTVVENDSPKIEWLDEWHEGTHPIYWKGKSAFYKGKEEKKQKV